MRTTDRRSIISGRAGREHTHSLRKLRTGFAVAARLVGRRTTDRRSIISGRAGREHTHLLRKLRTGFAVAARTACQLTVASAIARASTAAPTKNQALSGMRKAKSWSH